MPDRWLSRCSIVTVSSTSGRSEPSTDRADVVSSSAPSATMLRMVDAVKPFVTLADPS